MFKTIIPQNFLFVKGYHNPKLHFERRSSPVQLILCARSTLFWSLNTARKTNNLFICIYTVNTISCIVRSYIAQWVVVSVRPIDKTLKFVV
jgi:hypothetical protein